MSWFFKLLGNSSGNGAEVTANSRVKVDLETDVATNPSQVGGVRNFSENDNGTLTGVPYLKSPETSIDYRLRTGMDTILFVDTFNATTQNTDRWNYIFNTLTCSQPGAGTLNFGTVQGTAATHGAIMKTFQYFPVIGTAPLSVEFSFGLFTALLVSGEEFRVGIGNPTVAGTVPTDSVAIKINSTGVYGELIYNNGTATLTALLKAAGTITLTQIYKFVIVIGEHEIEYWLDDVLLAEQIVPSSQGQPILQDALPIYMQKICTGAVSNTNTVRVSDITVSLMDIATNKPWFHQLAGMGKSINLGQNSGTMGQTALWGNSAVPTATVLTNTTTAFTGLGGITAVLPTLPVGTDGILISYQNPTSTLNITGRNLIITGVQLKGAVSVVFVGGAVAYMYAVAYGHTNVSLATSETGSFVTATAHAPRRIFIGAESYPITSAVGTLGQGVTQIFDTPLIVRPGEFIAIIARNVGIVTTSGAITIGCNFTGYWE